MIYLRYVDFLLSFWRKSPFSAESFLDEFPGFEFLQFLIDGAFRLDPDSGGPFQLRAVRVCFHRAKQGEVQMNLALKQRLLRPLTAGGQDIRLTKEALMLDTPISRPQKYLYRTIDLSMLTFLYYFLVFNNAFSSLFRLGSFLRYLLRLVRLF